MNWAFADPSPAIDDWIRREDPSAELRDRALGRLLDLTDDPLPAWSVELHPGRWLADLCEDPLICAMYGLDFDEMLIYLKTIDHIEDD